MKIYFIFNIHRLKKLYKEHQNQENLKIVKDQQKYEIEKITKERDNKFRIK